MTDRENKLLEENLSVTNKTIHCYLPATCIKSIYFSVFITFFYINNLWWNTDHSHKFLSFIAQYPLKRNKEKINQKSFEISYASNR